MNLAERIKSAEEKYRQILEEYFINTWGDTALFSHDIYHHRRVWYYAKELLAETAKNEAITFSFSPDRLLIACYFHDLGMSVDTGERHGIHSSHLCRQFITANRLPEYDFNDLFTAIEDHDKKEYFVYTNLPDLKTYLTIADDLDAYGYIGIARYLEIYLKRGIPPEEIGYKIMDNASKRFGNFRSAFGNSAGIAEKHTNRYTVIDDFFYEYNRQIKDHSFKNKNCYGHAFIIELFLDMIRKGISSTTMLIVAQRSSEDPVVRNFAEKLNSELNEFTTIK